MGTENIFARPEKPFMLISQLQDGHMMVTWHDTEKALLWLAQNNTAATPVTAIEIECCRDIEIEAQ